MGCGASTNDSAAPVAAAPENKDSKVQEQPLNNKNSSKVNTPQKDSLK